MPRTYSVNASSALRARPPETSHSELPRTTMSIVSAKMGDEIPPMPPHWIFDGERESPNYAGSTMQKVVLVTHRAFCAVTIGSSNLRPLWERCNDGGWEEGRNSLRERIQHTNIVVRFFGFKMGVPFLIFIGWFASYHNRNLLHHRSAEGFSMVAVHEGGPCVSHSPVLWTFLRRSHRRIHNRVVNR